MPAPEVSVVISTFNRPRLLARALESVAANTFTDLEVVVVNDGGADVSTVVATFEDDIDVRLVTHDRNRGVTATQNTGIAHARGRYLSLLADDDRHLPEHLATLHAATGHEVVYTDGFQVMEDADGNDLSRTVLPVPRDFDRNELLVTNFIPACCLLLPREAVVDVGCFDEDLLVLEDWDLWLRLSAVLPFRHLPVPTLEYRVRGGMDNITTRDWHRFHGALETVYAKHPVSDRTLLARRAAFLEGASGRKDAQLFDTSVVLASEGDIEILVAAIERVAGELDGTSYEVIVHVPETPATSALREAIDGDVTFLFGADVPMEDAYAIGTRRASGRTVVHLRDVEVVDRPSGALLAS